MSKKSDKQPDVPMTPEERATAEAEKAALLAQLSERGSRGSVRVYIPAATPSPAAPAKVAEVAPAPEPEPPTPPTRPVAELKAEMQALERQLAEAQRQEAAVKQHQRAAEARETQRQAAESLAPLVPNLDAALRELDRVQRTFGPTLRSMARSCASGSVEQRRTLSEAYSAAAPLGARLGEARRVIESALVGVTRASDSGREHEVQQAIQLAHAALAVNLITLETDARVLVEAVEEAKGGRAEVQGLTADHMDPRDLRGPASSLTSVDFGLS